MKLRNWLKKLNLILSRKPGRQSEYEVFKDLDELPVWNWFQFHKKNDRKFFLKVKDYTKNYSISKSQSDFIDCLYGGMVSDLTGLDLSIYEAKVSYQLELFRFLQRVVENTHPLKEPEVLDAVFKTVIGLYRNDDPDPESLYSIPLKDTDLRKSLVQIARVIWDYKRIKDKPVRDQDLDEKIARINVELKIQLNKFTCSTKEFFEYQKLYLETMTKKYEMQQ